MTMVAGLAVIALLAQSVFPTFAQRTVRGADGSIVRYGLAVPGDYDSSSSRPLVVALHPGEGGTPFYGDRFLRSVFLPGLRELNPIMIAPDAPGQSWTDAQAEQAVMSLVRDIIAKFAVDARRVLVVGFSMGGRGAWFLSARHADRFTAAIVMAGQSEEQVADLARIPTYVIHSRDDERVAFDQAAGRVDALQRGGRWVREQWDQ